MSLKATAKTSRVTRQWAVAGGIVALALTAMLSARWRYVPTEERTVRGSTIVSPAPLLPGVLLDLPPHMLPQAQTTTMTIAYRNPEIVLGGIKQLPAAVPQTRMVPKQPSSLPDRVQHTSQPPRFIGRLEVRSDPMSSAVFIDRRYVGDSPVEVAQLRAGSHAVWVERDGYRRWTASVLVPAEKHVRIDVTLEPNRNP